MSRWNADKTFQLFKDLSGQNIFLLRFDFENLNAGLLKIYNVLIFITNTYGLVHIFIH